MKRRHITRFMHKPLAWRRQWTKTNLPHTGSHMDCQTRWGAPFLLLGDRQPHLFLGRQRVQPFPPPLRSLRRARGWPVCAQGREADGGQADQRDQ